MQIFLDIKASSLNHWRRKSSQTNKFNQVGRRFFCVCSATSSGRVQGWHCGASGRQTVSQSQHLPRCMANNYDFSEWSAWKCKSRWPLVWFRRRATLTHSPMHHHTHIHTARDRRRDTFLYRRCCHVRTVKDQYLKCIYMYECVLVFVTHTQANKKSLFLFSVVNVPGTYTVDAVLWMKMRQIKCDKSCHRDARENVWRQ